MIIPFPNTHRVIVGFTGTHYGPTSQQHDAMARWLRAMPIAGFVHGGEPHSDTFAHDIVRRFHPDARIDIYPGDRRGLTTWLKQATVVVHPVAPYLERDRRIVSVVHGLLAVPHTDAEEISSGTWATVRYARKLSLPVYIVRKDGTIVRDKYFPMELLPL